MEKHLRKLPQELFALIECGRDTASHLGVRAYIVGGFVRDLVMGVPTFDLDICVEGDGIAFAREYSRRLHASGGEQAPNVIGHTRFGTATVVLPSRHKIDLASTRQETYASPGALPLVSRSGLRDDLARRDFTINTLALSLEPGSFGKLIDLFGGGSDIRAKKVRILHDASFIDDPTRILRAIRFEQRYRFRIEPHTLSCLKQALGLRIFQAVGPHRLRDEIILMLKERCPLRQIGRMSALSCLDVIHPAVRLNPHTRGLLLSAEKQAAWFERNCQPHRRLEKWLILMMALFDSAGPEALLEACDRFALRSSERVRMLSYLHSQRHVVQALKQKGLRPSQVYQLLEPLSLEAIVMIKAKADRRLADAYIGSYLGELHAVRIGVTGHHLKESGIAPGPAYQEALRAVLFARLDGRVRTREEELACARQWLKTHQ